MAKQSDKQRIFTRRAVVLGGLQLAAFGALASRLYYLQFIKSEEYKTLSENNRIKLQLVAPPRGHILDWRGDALAINQNNFQLYLDATGIARRELMPIVERVGKIITLTDRRVKQAAEDIKTNPYGAPILLKEHIEWQEVAAIELRQMDLPGVYVDIGILRVYPYGEHCAHLLGYVGAVSKDEVGDEPLLRLPDFKIGKAGVEKMLEENLRGAPGIRQLEVDVHGISVRELDAKPSVPGDNMRLTVDSRLQEYAAQLLEGQSASLALMNVSDGNVLCMTSMPGFDPNIFSKGIPQTYWDQLHGNDHTPLINKAVQGQYPPGSTFKLVTGLAGLRSGAVKPGFHVHCPGYFWLGDHKFTCWKTDGHGSVDMESAIAQSCDTFFYTVAQHTGIGPIAEVARALGLGAAFDFGFPGEKDGIVPDPAWKYKRYKQRWEVGDTVNVGIGQGYVLATPLQLCVMMARTVNGGLAVTPRLTVPADEKAAPEFAACGIADDHLALIRRGTEAVVNSAPGTAYGKRIMDPRYAMGGKTGTSQVRKLVRHGIVQDTIPWEQRYHAFFVGYAPISAPKYAISVAIEHGGGGGAAAAPVARDLLLKVQQLAAEDAK